jgi:hypothetical protein
MKRIAVPQATPLLAMLLLVIGASYACGQTLGPNLVLNPSFEEMDTCPWTPGMETWDGQFGGSISPPPTHWVNPTPASPDYYTSCANPDLGMSVPYSTLATFQFPRTGNAYVAIGTALWADTAANGSEYGYREYVQGRFSEPLEIGKVYRISFWVNRSSVCIVAMKGLAAALSEQPIHHPSDLYPWVITNPQLRSDEFITDTTDWVEVHTLWEATQPMEYITIGFFDTLCTNRIDVASIEECDSSSIICNWASYYFIDDVSVAAYDTVLVSQPETIGGTRASYYYVPNIITPNGDGIADELRPMGAGGYTLKIYDVNGNLISVTTNRGYAPSDNTPQGVYYYILASDRGLIKSGAFLIQR